MNTRSSVSVAQYVWNKLRVILALIIITLGVVVGLISLILPFEGLYKEPLQRFLSEQWDTEVIINELEGQWQGTGPLFSLRDLELSGKQSITIASAQLSIHLLKLLWPGGNDGIDLTIKEAEAVLVKSKKSGLLEARSAQGDSYSSALEQVLNSGRIQIENLQLSLLDEQQEIILNRLQTNFAVEQAEGQRGLKLTVEQAQLGDKMELKAISQEGKEISKQAELHLMLEAINLQAIGQITSSEFKLPELYFTGAAWFSTQNGMIEQSQGTFEITSSSKQNIKPEISASVEFFHAGREKKWRAKMRLYDIFLDKQPFEPIDAELIRENENYLIHLESLSVSELQAFLSLVPDQSVPDWASSLNGELNDITIVYDVSESRISSIRIHFEQLALASEQIIVNGLSGQLEYKNNRVNLLLDNSEGSMEMPLVFKGRLNWQRLIAQTAIELDQWQAKKVSINSLWCDCIDFRLNTDALWSSGEQKSLYLNAYLEDFAIDTMYKYWPHSVWTPATIGWLNSALKGGVVGKGHINYSGQVGKKMFEKQLATFKARAFVDNAEVEYHPDWPRASNLDAIADFYNHSMAVQVLDASVGGNRINEAEATIQHFKDGSLEMHVLASAEQNSLTQFMKQSPLLKKLKAESDFSIFGRQDINLEFTVPYQANNKGTFDPVGEVIFYDSAFNTSEIQLEKINGRVAIKNKFIDLTNVNANFLSFPVKLEGGIQTYSDAKPSIDALMKGRLGIQNLLRRFAIAAPISGDSDWSISLQTRDDRLHFVAQSDLVGVSSQLPAPLEKGEEQSKDISIDCELPCEGKAMRIAYGETLNSTIVKNSNEMQLGSMIFGETDLNETNFGGRLDTVNVDQWLSYFSQNTESNEDSVAEELNGSGQRLPSDRIAVTVDKLIFMSREFNNIDLVFQQLPGSILIEIDSTMIKGEVELPENMESKGIIIDLETLYWTDVNPEYLNQSENSSYSMPDLHIWIDDFYYSDIPLGQMRMETRKIADGMKIEQLSTSSDLLNLNINGQWTPQANSTGISDFEIVMISENIADFMSHVGLTAPLKQAQTIITLDVSWAGLPSQFNLSEMYGELDIKVGSGEVVDSDPGIGRVLGLFSLTSLPRRLLLDFRDVFAEGLRFESMEGRFNLSEGRAVTESFIITASSAKILISGATDLVGQTYDQLISVQPQVGKTFPTIGALAGGAVGAAAGFVVQGIFERALKNPSEIQYKVTGTWKEPEIELLDEK